MAEVVIYHHAQGLTPGVVAFADDLRRAGHTVHTPDLYDGRTFTTLDEGVGHAEQIGFGEVIERGLRAVEGLPTDLVYAGFSLGVLPAQRLAQTRAGARGALLCYACVPPSEVGLAWPGGLPVQVHGTDADPFFVDEGDIDAARTLVAGATDAELFLYPGDQHLVADSSLLSYDADAAALLKQRVLAFLASIDGRPPDEPDGQSIYAWDATTVGEDNRADPPMAGDEIATLLGTLERNRSTLAWKCNGLDATAMQVRLGASAITLGGLLKHLALVEDNWFSVRLHGHDRQAIWTTGDWKNDPDWDWTSAKNHTPGELFILWSDAVTRSRALVDEALAEGGLDFRASFTWPDGRSPSLRRMVTDLIEEYARHCGYADLIRESIDGALASRHD